MASEDLTGLEPALRRLVSDLRGCDARFALVGALAVSVRAEPRLTRDTDVAVSVQDDEEAERLVRLLAQEHYRPEALVEHEVTGRLATVRLSHPLRPGVVADLLFASCGIEPEIVDHAEDLEVLPGLVVPVARIGHLMAMKLLARDDRQRPADADDLRVLTAIANEEEWALALDSATLITERGYHRGRDLQAALTALGS